VVSNNKHIFEREFEILCKCAERASKELLLIVKNGFEKSYKENEDPVTTGDTTVNSILQEEFTKHFPEIGWLSEETRDNPDRLEKELVWIVDPIDGTKEFVMGIPEYSISIALVQNGNPVLGLILNPLREEIYTGIKGQGAYLNGKPIKVKEILDERPTIVASRSEINRGEFEQFEDVAKIIPTGSIAYKLALVAAGRVDGTFSLGPKNEWDIAAGCLILEEAGGVAKDQYGQSFIFNQKDTLVNSIVGTSKVASRQIYEMIEKVRNNNE
jgi:myo-inositol-1(or 4)-monophosphatase